MSRSNNIVIQSKLTKGDKCILYHIAFTLLFIIVLVIIYLVHLLTVKHDGWDALRVTRRNIDHYPSMGVLRSKDPGYSSVGAAYIQSEPSRIICNTILMKQQWSLAPAHCVTIRSDPDLSQFLPKWRIKYNDNGQTKETDVKRGIVHSYFNKDDFDDNIGLFEHLERILGPELIFTQNTVSDLLNAKTDDLSIVEWNEDDEISSKPVRLLSSAKCSQFVSPIVDTPRATELCVMQTQEILSEGVHGGALISDSQIVGFFSWGDRRARIPQVVLALEPYKGWLENMIALNV